MSDIERRVACVPLKIIGSPRSAQCPVHGETEHVLILWDYSMPESTCTKCLSNVVMDRYDRKTGKAI